MSLLEAPGSEAPGPQRVGRRGVEEGGGRMGVSRYTLRLASQLSKLLTAARFPHFQNENYSVSLIPSPSWNLSFRMVTNYRLDYFPLHTGCPEGRVFLGRWLFSLRPAERLVQKGHEMNRMFGKPPIKVKAEDIYLITNQFS